MLAVLVISAVVVVRRSPAGKALRGLLLWVVSLFVVVPLLVRLSSVHFGGEASYLGEDYEYSAYLGVHGVQATFFLTGIAILVALAVAAVTRNLDLETLGRDVGRVLGNLQSSPSQRTGSAPAHPPPSEPPPAPPPVPPTAPGGPGSPGP
jgi:hypothetical protein